MRRRSSSHAVEFTFCQLSAAWACGTLKNSLLPHEDFLGENEIFMSKWLSTWDCLFLSNGGLCPLLSVLGPPTGADLLSPRECWRDLILYEDVHSTKPTLFEILSTTTILSFNTNSLLLFKTWCCLLDTQTKSLFLEKKQFWEGSQYFEWKNLDYKITHPQW